MYALHDDPWMKPQGPCLTSISPITASTWERDLGQHLMPYLATGQPASILSTFTQLVAMSNETAGADVPHPHPLAQFRSKFPKEPLSSPGVFFMILPARKFAHYTASSSLKAFWGWYFLCPTDTYILTPALDNRISHHFLNYILNNYIIYRYDAVQHKTNLF